MSGLHRLIITLALAGLLAIVVIVGIDRAANALPASESQGEQGATAQEEGEEPEEYAPGEILVKFKESTSEAEKDEIHNEKDAQAIETLPKVDVEAVAVESGQEKAKVEEYQDDPNVEFAEVNGVYEALQTISRPNDSRVSEQWQYKNSKYLTPKKGDIDAYEAWSGLGITWDGGTTGSSSVAIAILDTGIKEDHADLTGKVTKRTNFTASSTSGDVQGHGTHVAGSAAALTNNQKGVAGTCPRCTLYNVKVLGDSGSGYTSWIANGIRWATDNGARVINMSLGSPSPSSTLQSAIDYAWSKGVVIVAAAGNSGTDAQFYPAAYGKAIAVGATDNTDAKASYSNYGSSWVDVAAPGSSILSTTVDGSYGWMSGTSMATPHVAGEAGLVWSKSGLCGASDNACVRNQIESKADKISGTGTYWAYGRANANGGVGGGTSALLPIDSTAPTVSTTAPSDRKTGVKRGTNVNATFSEAIDPATLSSSTFTLVKSGSTTPISATVAVSSDGKTGTLKPYGSAKTNLSKCTWYTATVTTGVKDEAGNSLAAEKVWSFNTSGC